MRYPIGWLRTFVNPAMDDQALCERLTMSGLEVEAIEKYGNDSPFIVVGEVLEVATHPSADQLKVCRVRSHPDSAPLTIVCGAPNVRVGMKAPLALIGARIQDREIASISLRGIVSQGMLCSAEELALGDIHVDKSAGLLVLPAEAEVGKPLCTQFPSSDQLLTIKLTPNRGDCLSILGLAREISALTQTPLTLPKFKEIFADSVETIKINSQLPEGCLRYTGRSFHGLNTHAQTPLWMRMRLVQCGERPKSPLVDITNFVMIEWGQPMHAFDRDALRGKIGIRYAREGESLMLLNDQSVNLTAQQMVITDDDRAIALAGVMGGKDTAIHAQTTRVFFEAAHFTASAVQGTARQFGLSSLAAYRFERGVDPTLPRIAQQRASMLTQSIMGGQCGEMVEVQSAPVKPLIVPLRLSRARALIGYPYSAMEVEQSLRALGFVVRQAAVEHYAVEIPSYRSDVRLEEDLIEEVVRLVGYDAVPEAMPSVETPTPTASTPSQKALQLSQTLADRGFREVMHFGFIDDKIEQLFAEPQTQTVRLANPIAENLNVMRSQLIGSLVLHCAQAHRSQASTVAIFEWSRVFCFKEEPRQIDSAFAHQHPTDIYSARGRYHQPYHLGMLLWGAAHPMQWGRSQRLFDFYDLKGCLESLIGMPLPSFNATASSLWQINALDDPQKHPCLHPNRAGDLVYEGQKVGRIGELHPQMVKHFDLPSAPIVLECAADPLVKVRSMRYQAIHRQPMIERDLSIWVGDQVRAADIIEDLSNAKIAALQEVVIFDVYQQAHRKSLALRFWLQDQEKTLDDIAISRVMETIQSRLQSRFQATLRE